MRTCLLLVPLALVALAVVVRSAGAEPPAAPSVATNPFFTEWTTPFGVPPFDLIKNEHFLPAYREAITRKRAEVEAIAADAAPPTFANTLEALDGTGRLLDKVEGVFSNLNSADTNDSLEAVAKEVAPLQAGLRDDILLNEALFRRVKAVWESRSRLGLEPEQARLVEETYSDFVRGGANLDAAKKQRLRTINQELSVLSVTFGQNLRKETIDYKLVIERKEDLAGLSDRLVAAAAEAAKGAGLEGKWVFGLQAPSVLPFLEAADNRELRHQVQQAYITRGDHGNARDNNATLAKIAALRAEKARLLGYKTYADFVLEKQMAKTPDRVYDLMRKVWVPALAVAHRELAALQGQIDKSGGKFKLEPWDWRYYSEKERKARYDLDEDEVRPYFALDNVRQGAFYVANKLYGVTFTERKDLPVYNPEVRAFEVKDADGSHLGVYYVDYHPRPGKRNGAWSSEFREQCFRDGQDVRPVVANTCNFSRPAGAAPALLSVDEAETLFHEFGHALQALFQRIHYKSLASVPRDLVELPSQIMENWVLEPEVLKVYARHWETGEVIPAALIDKIQRARKFNQGFITVEYTAAAYLDMDWHTLTEPKEMQPAAFEKTALAKIDMMPEIVVRYRSPYFAHIFGGGYAAGYYSYLWADVLNADAFSAFKEKGLFDQATASSFRHNILERGGTDEAMNLWLGFRGREPKVEPLLERRGLL